MSSSSSPIGEMLSELHKIAPAGYALGVHMTHMAPKFVFQTYPKAWLDHYSANGLIMVDPMVAWGFENTGHERWSALDDASGVLKAAGEFGMKFGAVVVAESEASRSIGGFAHPDREFTDEELDALLQGVTAIHASTEDTAELSQETIDHLRKMAVMVTHPGS
ncbi:MAG: autoinducer binding domain-containing protein [Pseudomonadota bacterium]